MRLPADGKIVNLITFAPEAEQSDCEYYRYQRLWQNAPIADYSRKTKAAKAISPSIPASATAIWLHATLVSETDDLMLITSGGVLIRTKVEQIRETGCCRCPPD